MKIFNLINSILALFITTTKYGQAELNSSISIRAELEQDLNLKKVSILLAKLEQITELDLSTEDKNLLTVAIQSKIQGLLNANS